jgi:hypothetical protein
MFRGISDDIPLHHIDPHIREKVKNERQAYIDWCIRHEEMPRNIETIINKNTNRVIAYTLANWGHTKTYTHSYVDFCCMQEEYDE